MTKFLNISVDNTLGGNSPSDVLVSSQKAVKEYVDSHGGGGSASIDNVTITKNTNDELQASGIINKNENTGAVSPLGIWNGTETQWNQGEATTWYNWVNSGYTMATRTLSVNSRWRGAASDGSKVIVVSNNSSTYLYTTNGTSWSSGTFSSGITPSWIVYGNGTWVAINSTTDVVYSSNGSSWSTASLPAGYKNWLIYGEKFITTNGSYLYYSSDGSSWQTVDLSSQNINFSGITYGNNKYVAITIGTSITTSDDAITWTDPTSVFSGSMSQISYGNGRFVALPTSSSSRTTAYSEDGVTWTEVANALPQGQSSWDLVFAGGVFIATAYQSANACYSLDGATWTSLTLPSNLSWYGKAPLGDEVLIVGYNSNQYVGATFTNLSVYTTDENPTTASTVYDDKNVVSTYTITGVGTGTITLSNNKTCTYNSAGNLFDYITVGSAHPDWLCNINGVGVKIGDTMVATKDDPVAIDNTSITKNTSDELQTVGVIDSNNITNAIKTWTGTKAQYDAIVTKDANTLYNITDDTDVTLTILEALYPVGSIYITTANTCPLSALISGSTWTLRSSGVLTDVTGSSSAPVKGNGTTLGVTDGTHYAGVLTASSSGNYAMVVRDDRYGTAVGSSVSGSSSTISTKTISITTDPTKSGVVADISNAITKTTLAVNIFERTA